MSKLSVSVVTYHSDSILFDKTLQSLLYAIAEAGKVSSCELYVVDNGDELSEKNFIENDYKISISLITGQGNVGYGRGHNIALKKVDSKYHLILNPDVLLADDSIVNAIDFMETHPECGLLSPRVEAPNGTQLFLCKKIPSFLDLVLRGFAPEYLRSRFQSRLDDYEMRDVIGDTVYWDPPVVSGCFMLFRTATLKRLHGFSSGYFLYFEDFDLSLRTAIIARIAYVPTVRIIHYGGDVARKGFRHILYFCQSAFTFFNKHGWKWK